MSASLYHPSIALAADGRPLRFGAEGANGERSVQWLLRRNCSSTPRQLSALFLVLAMVTLSIGGLFWFQGVRLVMPFAGLELLAVGVALLHYARHATDREFIRLRPGQLMVEHVCAGRVERVEFAPAWVRVEPRHGDRSLVEVSGQGRRISVGRFVRPEARRQLAEELRWALRRWQGMRGPDTSISRPCDKFEN
jgi:uncharacterized membrane protein